MDGAFFRGLGKILAPTTSEARSTGFVVRQQAELTPDHTLPLWDGFASIKATPKFSKYHFNRHPSRPDCERQFGRFLRWLKSRPYRPG
jgi:hypothetical protein